MILFVVLSLVGYLNPVVARVCIPPLMTHCLEVKETMDHPASILKYRLERDGIPLALVETPDSLVLVPEGETIGLAETSFKYSGLSISGLPGMNKKEVHIGFGGPQTLVIREKSERTYTSRNPPAGFVEGPSMHEAMKGDGDEHNKSQPQQLEKGDKHDEKTKY
uniref:Uncharacterized protein n=1 Tax=Fusarium oxysporum (strain Fo5176) TaxID=660025 RepID=A0A0D2YIF3_FUSOF